MSASLPQVAAVGSKSSSMSFSLVGDPSKNSLDLGQPGADRRSRRRLRCSLCKKGGRGKGRG